MQKYVGITLGKFIFDSEVDLDKYDTILLISHLYGAMYCNKIELLDLLNIDNNSDTYVTKSDLCNKNISIIEEVNHSNIKELKIVLE